MRQLTDADLAQILDTPMFHRIGQIADEMGVECYVVGGYVRDLFLDRPSKDIDCVVVRSQLVRDADAEEGLVTPGIALARRLGKELGRGANVSVFKNFGTAQVKWHGQEVEFVGARRESYNRGSRKPVVEDGTLEDDLDRRDFTINALAVQLNEGKFGHLVDRFDGLLDMEDGIIATPLDPDITFSDDPLRMMRCVRFATQLRFQIEDATADALCRNAERIRIISQERIIDELNKIMLSPVPSIGFVELERSGLLDIILPEIAALRGVESRNGRAHKDNFYHTLEVLDNISRETSNLYLRWAALLHDIGKPKSKRWEPSAGWTFHNHNYIGMKMIQPLFRRMKLPMDERMHYVEKLVSMHMRPQVIADDEVTDSAVRRMLFEAGEDIDDLMTLCEADITSKNAQKKQRFLDNFRLVREKIIDRQERDNYRTWTNPISGEEIMATFGLRPCREVGLLKQAVKDAIWELRISGDHDTAFAYMLTEAEKLGLRRVDEPGME